MRAKEFIAETADMGTTSSGSIATAIAEHPIGMIQKRSELVKVAKYANSAPVGQLRKKQNVN